MLVAHCCIQTAYLEQFSKDVLVGQTMSVEFAVVGFTTHTVYNKPHPCQHPSLLKTQSNVIYYNIQLADIGLGNTSKEHTGRFHVGSQYGRRSCHNYTALANYYAFVRLHH